MTLKLKIKKSVICFKVALHSFQSIFSEFCQIRQKQEYFFLIFATIRSILLKSMKDISNNKSIAFKTTPSDFHGTCLEENLPYPLFQARDFSKKLSHLQAPMHSHANASPINLELLFKTAIWGYTEQRLNACRPSTFSTICHRT